MPKFVLKMKNAIERNKVIIGGGILGAIGGWCFWYFVGCASGSCAITSSPVNSALYGALLGGLFANLFKKEKKEDQSKP
jgi:hypothetical protein